MKFVSLAVKILIVVGLIAGVGIFFQQQMIATAVVAPVVRGTAVDAVPGTVEVEADLIMELRSEIGGRIVEGTLRPGQRVSRGEVLIQMDTEDLELEIEQIRSRMEIISERQRIGSPLRFDEMTLQEDVENLEKLVEDGSVPRIELDRKRRELEQLQERMRLEGLQDREALSQLEINLLQKERRINQATVRSPMDGSIDRVYAHPGDLIGGGAPLARIISMERRVEARISEENFRGIEVGQPATVRFLSYPRELFDARVSQVLSSVDQSTQRYTVYLDVDIDIDRLLPGLSGEVSIIRGSRTDTLLIPRRALLGNFVFVVNPDGIVERRQVMPGFLSLNQAEIEQNLAEGERVITQNLDRFRDGDRVRWEER